MVFRYKLTDAFAAVYSTQDLLLSLGACMEAAGSVPFLPQESFGLAVLATVIKSLSIYKVSPIGSLAAKEDPDPRILQQRQLSHEYLFFCLCIPLVCPAPTSTICLLILFGKFAGVGYAAAARVFQYSGSAVSPYRLGCTVSSLSGISVKSA